MVINLSENQVYSQTPQNKSIKQPTVKCTCPDHPDVIKDQLGNCPKCGMKLEEKKGIKKGVDPKMKQTPMDMKKDTNMLKKIK